MILDDPIQIPSPCQCYSGEWTQDVSLDESGETCILLVGAVEGDDIIGFLGRDFTTLSDQHSSSEIMESLEFHSVE